MSNYQISITPQSTRSSPSQASAVEAMDETSQQSSILSGSPDRLLRGRTSGLLRPKRKSKMPLRDRSASARFCPAPSSRGELRALKKLKNPVPACEILEKNTSLQIRDAARVMAGDRMACTSEMSSTHDDADSGSDNDGPQNAGDDMLAESSTGEERSDHLRTSQPDAEQAEEEDMIPISSQRARELETELFVKIASDWRPLDPSFLKFRFVRPDLREESSLDETVELVQKMSTSHHSVANFMNCQVGRLLTRRASENPQYLSELAKRSAQLKLQRYSELLLQCGCTKCQATHEWDRNRQAILDSNTCVAEPTASEYDEARRPVPCPVTQLRIDHVNSVFSGLSATHLDRTVRFARSVIPGEGLSLVAVPASKVLTCSKILEHAVSKEPRKIAAGVLSNRQTAHITPPGVLVELDRSDVHCFDGDGVDIPREAVCKLANVNGLGPPSDMSVHPDDRVRCRLGYIDCPEIGDAFIVKRREAVGQRWNTELFYEAGMHSLRCLRHYVRLAKTLFVALPLNSFHDSLCQLPTAAHGRVLVDIWYKGGQEAEGGEGGDESESLRSVSLSLLVNGVAVVDKRYRPPMVSYAAEHVARESRVGLFQLPQEVTHEDSPIMPWKTRIAQDVATPKVLCNLQNDLCRVIQAKSKETLESLVYVAPSTVSNAGNGLFLKGRMFDIAPGRYLCEYTTVWHASRDISGLIGHRDYLVDVGPITYDGEEFTGINYGRYVNDLGLMDTIQFAVANAKRSVSPVFPYEQVMARSKAAANCTYRVEWSGQSRRLVVIAKKTIPAGGPVELSAAYDFIKYWIAGVAESPSRFPPSVADPILWMILSDNSNLTDTERTDFTGKLWQKHRGLTTLDPAIQQYYRTAEEPPGLTADFRVL